MGYLLMLLNCFMGGFSTIMSKTYVKSTASFQSSKTIYILLAHPLAAIYFLRKLCDGYAERYTAILMVISGVIGNSIDRIWRGEVVDFLDFYIKSYHWPAFNIADCAICIGVGLYTLSVIVRPAPENGEKN